MDDMRRKAKMDLLQDLRKMAMGMIHDGSGEEMPDHMQKVMVAAPDKEGLKHGLEKAKEVVQGGAVNEMDHGDDHDESMEDPSEEASESPEQEASEDDEDSPEAIHAKIQELHAKLAKAKK